jgi:CheY-like chemotaxis protein
MQKEVRAESVLIAEDDHDLLEVMTLVLEEEGYRVMIARDGREALERIREHMPDLILLDMKMPDLSGPEFAAQYIASHPTPGARAPMVVITAAEHPASRAQEVAAEGYLSKPFTHAELLSEVRRHLPSTVPAAER